MEAASSYLNHFNVLPYSEARTFWLKLQIENFIIFFRENKKSLVHFTRLTSLRSPFFIPYAASENLSTTESSKK